MSGSLREKNNEADLTKPEAAEIESADGQKGEFCRKRAPEI